MIKRIIVTNPRSESVTLDLRNPEESGFFIRRVDGLGAGKATINTSESLSLPGGRFNSSRKEMRNIVFDIGYLENPTIEHSRLSSYRYFPLEKEVEIRVETDLRTIRTSGYVESNEPAIFEEQSGASISIICPDPYFYAIDDVLVEFGSIVSAFEFPFSNESLVSKLIKFGDILLEPSHNVYYSGETATGIIMNILAFGPVGTIVVQNTKTLETMTVDSDILTELTGSGLNTGDKVTISTVKGNKFAVLDRGGVVFNIVNALGFGTDWFSLELEDNPFVYDASSGISNLRFSIQHKIVYEGV